MSLGFDYKIKIIHQKICTEKNLFDQDQISFSEYVWLFSNYSLNDNLCMNISQLKI
jgi:hypothetical protein